MTTDNEKYVKRGQVLVIRDDPQRDREVAAANLHKVGAPFLYAESLFAALAVVKSITGLPYRYLQGMLMMTLADEDALCCTTIFRRLQSLDVKREGNVFTVTGNGAIPGQPAPKAARPPIRIHKRPRMPNAHACASLRFPGSKLPPFFTCWRRTRRKDRFNGGSRRHRRRVGRAEMRRSQRPPGRPALGGSNPPPGAHRSAI